MKLGVGSYTWTWACGVPGSPPLRPMTLGGICARARQLGVSLVQVCENLPCTLDDLRAEAGAGMAIEIGTRGIDSLPRAMDQAQACGSRIIRLVIDAPHDEPTVGEAADRLAGPIEAMADAGIQLAIENHDRFAAAEVAGLVEALGPDRAGVTLDTVNSFGALEGPEAVVTRLAPYALSLHLKDFTIRRAPSQMGFIIEGCPLGEGRLDVPWIIDKVAASGRDPNAIVELWTPPAESLEATLVREDAWAEKSVVWMQSVLPE